MPAQMPPSSPPKAEQKDVPAEVGTPQLHGDAAQQIRPRQQQHADAEECLQQPEDQHVQLQHATPQQQLPLLQQLEFSCCSSSATPIHQHQQQQRLSANPLRLADLQQSSCLPAVVHSSNISISVWATHLAHPVQHSATQGEGTTTVVQQQPSHCSSIWGHAFLHLQGVLPMHQHILTFHIPLISAQRLFLLAPAACFCLRLLPTEC